MDFNRTTLPWDNRSSDAAAFCTALPARSWTIEAEFCPPDEHDPARLLLGNDISDGFALSVGSVTAAALSLGPALAKRLVDFGLVVGPLAGLALHELIVNAVIHGNLRVESGDSDAWGDLGKRHHAIDEALADPVRSSRMVTIAIGWRRREVTAVIADEGSGYDITGSTTTRLGCGRGLRLARMVGRVRVMCGGRQTAIALEYLPLKGRQQAMRAGVGTAPIIVVSPDPDEANQIATWLRGAGLGRISIVRTCDEAIFLLGRGRLELLIIDDAISDRGERRLIQHIRAAGRAEQLRLVRLVGAHDQIDPAAAGLQATELIRKPLAAHEVVLRVGAALQRPDLLGRLDQSRDQAAQHLAAARQMQIGLLPGPEQLRTIREQCGVGVAGLYRAGEEVGGDLWGIWPTGRGRFALAIADFVGHGLSAALNTFRLHALLSDQSLPRGQPTRMAALLNDRLHALLPRGHYATMIYLQIDPVRRRVAWCGAGAPAPLLLSADRSDDLMARGLPLGVRAGTAYRPGWMALPDTGLLVVFSDGLFESGGDDPEIPRTAIADALKEPVRLAAAGDLVAAAEEGTARLEALRDCYPSGNHSDDVMAVCVAFGPALQTTSANGPCNAGEQLAFNKN